MEYGDIILGIFNISKKLLLCSIMRLPISSLFIFQFFTNLFLNDAATIEIIERRSVESVSNQIITNYFWYRWGLSPVNSSIGNDII